MKKMTTEDIQNVSLDIMKNIHEFCVNHNIRYSLAYGTLLGAVRHAGFIPWDDDVDLFMPRPDYDKFCSEYQNQNGYELIYYPESMMPFARVCDTIKTYVDDGSCFWTKKEHGVWVDIFPIDGAEVSLESLNKRFDKANRLRLLSLLYRSSKMKLSKCSGSKEFLKTIVKRFIFFFYSPLPKMMEILQQYDYNSCHYVTNLSCPDSWGVEHLKKSIFEEYTTLSFNNYDFYVVKDYHSVLKDYYGDYMKLPPLDQQVTKHGVYKHYWK